MAERGAWALPLAGQVLGQRYRLDRLMGAGGMGAVFEGTHIHVGHRVAVKVIAPKIATSPEFLARFHQEARAAASVGSAGVVQVLDFDTDAKHGPYLVMEHLTGETLASVLKANGRLGNERSFRLVSQILETLNAVHARGIVHRDLKPDNVFITRSGPNEIVKLLDFGISRVERPEGRTALTLPGSLLGTPRYMAPEQARAQLDIDHRVDLYAAGAMLYVCLGGKPPYAGTHGDHVLAAVIQGPPAPLKSYCPDVPEPLLEVVRRAMERDRNARFQSASDMLGALIHANQRASMPAPFEVPETRFASTPESQGVSRGSREEMVTGPIPIMPVEIASTRLSGPGPERISHAMEMRASVPHPATVVERRGPATPYFEPTAVPPQGASGFTPTGPPIPGYVATTPVKPSRRGPILLIVGGVVAFGAVLVAAAALGYFFWSRPANGGSSANGIPASPTEDVPDEIAEAQRAAEQGRLEEARGLYDVIIARHPGSDPESGRIVGLAHIGLGDVMMARFRQIPAGRSFDTIGLTYESAFDTTNGAQAHYNQASARSGALDLAVCGQSRSAEVCELMGHALEAYGLAPTGFVDPMMQNASSVRELAPAQFSYARHSYEGALTMASAFHVEGPCVDAARAGLARTIGAP